MKCNCDICQRQYDEEQCIRRICSFFGWRYCRIPAEHQEYFETSESFNSAFHDHWEYLVLSNKGDCINSYTSAYKSIVFAKWRNFKDFLQWLNDVNYFTTSTAKVVNPFFQKDLTTIDKMNIALDFNVV